MRGEEDLARRLVADAETLRRRFEDVVLVRGAGVLRDGARRGEAAGQRDRLERRATACGRGIASPDRARRVVDRLMAPDMFSGWGIRTYASRPAGLQPDRLPHGHGLAARRVADRRGLQALRPPRGGEPPGRAGSSRPPSTSRTSACPSCSAASTATDSPVPVPYPVACSPQAWAAGSAVPVPRDDAGPPPARRPRASSSSSGPSCPDWLAEGDRSRTCGSATATVDLLFHRWRGGTSAEVLRKSRDLDVTIRM